MTIKGIAGVTASSFALLALAACGGDANNRNNQGFFVQSFGGPADSPAELLANRADEDVEGERISVTQHTGRLTVSGDLQALAGELLGGIGPLPAPSSAGVASVAAENPLTLQAEADGTDANPLFFEVNETGGGGPTVNIASTGELEIDVGFPFNQSGFSGVVLLAVDEDATEIDEGSQAVIALAGGGFGDLFSDDDQPAVSDNLNFMAISAFVAINAEDVDQQSEDFATAKFEFGIGHLGLQTPTEDMPTIGTASYTGTFAGLYVDPGVEGSEVDPGAIGMVGGLSELTADFGEGTVEGGVPWMGVTLLPLEGGPVTIDLSDQIEFTAMIDGSTFSGTAVTVGGMLGESDSPRLLPVGSSGNADGVFYGPVVVGGELPDDDVRPGPLLVPSEVGVVLTVQDDASGKFITGVIGADLGDMRF